MSELEQLRGDIDAIDRQIVDLMKRRMETVAQVAEYKKANNMPVLDTSRERALLSKVGQEAGEELADYVQSMYRTIMAASRSYENGKLGRGSKVYDGIKKAMEETPQLFPQRPTVACQGIEGAYSQIACDRLFKAPPSCISRALTTCSRRWRAACASMASCPSRTAPPVR